MGRPKQTLRFGDGTILGSVVKAVLSSRVTSTAVVLGYHADPVSAILSDLPVNLVINPSPEQGMLSSVQCGLRNVSDAEGYLVVLGDQPRLSPHVIDALIEASGSSSKSIYLPVSEGKRGHPLLLRAGLREAVLALPLTVGLNALLVERPEEIEEVGVGDSRILEDIDTPEDYQQLSGD